MFEIKVEPVAQKPGSEEPTVSDDPQFQELVGQLDQWQREKRLALRVGAALLVLSVGLIARATCFPARPAQLDVNRIVLRDAAGMVRMQMALDDEGMPRFQLFDPLGREQFDLRGLPDNSTLMAFYENGVRRASLVTPPEDQAALTFFHDEPEELDPDAASLAGSPTEEEGRKPTQIIETNLEAGPARVAPLPGWIAPRMPLVEPNRSEGRRHTPLLDERPA